MESKNLFITIIIINRCIEGWSFGLIQCMVYGVASQELAPTEFDTYARTCSASAGLGGCISLLAGPFLFSIGGYFLPYFVLCGSFVLLSFIIYVSGTLNVEEEEEESEFEKPMMGNQNDEESFTPSEHQIDWKFLLRIPVSCHT